MSKPWNPNRSRWLSDSDFKALSPGARRALFAARGQARNWARAQDYLRETAPKRRLPPGAKVALVLIAAVCAGIAVALYQVMGTHAQFTATDPSADWTAVATAPVRKTVRSIAPEPKPVPVDPADAEWAARASGGGATGLPRSSAARNGGVRVAFGSCKWGGGKNCVVDGDTFYLNGEKVRIADIDAPETHDYRCASELALGDRATERLQALLNSGAVTMTSIDRDRDVYGRLLRNVSVNGQDVGETLVSAGVARWYAGGRRPWC